MEKDMKVVRHEAVAPNVNECLTPVCSKGDKPFGRSRTPPLRAIAEVQQLQEMLIICFVEKYHATVNSTIVDMVILIKCNPNLRSMS